VTSRQVGETEAENEFPPKPPRMRWATYQRLQQQFDRLQDQWGIATMARFGRREMRVSQASA